jgi:hypothetical protein
MNYYSSPTDDPLDLEIYRKDINLDVHNVKMQLMEELAVAEQAKLKIESENDPEYLRLLRQKPLDPSSRKKIKEVRDTYVTVENKISDVTILLDAEWKNLQELKRNKRRGEPTTFSAIDSIFNILRNNNHCILQQSQTLDTLQDQMKMLDISTNKSKDSSRLNYPNLSASGGGGGGDANFEPKRTPRHPVISPERVALLRQSLSKR